MADNLIAAERCGRDFILAGVPLLQLHEALGFCDSVAECQAFIRGAMIELDDMAEACDDQAN